MKTIKRISRIVEAIAFAIILIFPSCQKSTATPGKSGSNVSVSGSISVNWTSKNGTRYQLTFGGGYGYAYPVSVYQGITPQYYSQWYPYTTVGFIRSAPTDGINSLRKVAICDMNGNLISTVSCIDNVDLFTALKYWNYSVNGPIAVEVCWQAPTNGTQPDGKIVTAYRPRTKAYTKEGLEIKESNMFVIGIQEMIVLADTVKASERKLLSRQDL